MQSTWHGHYVTSRHRLSKLFCLDEERESLNPVVNILPQVPYNSLPLPLSTKVSWEGLGRAEAKSSGADAIGRLPPMPLVCSETSPPPPRTQQALRVLPTGSNMSAGFYDEIRAASGAFKFFVRAPPIGFPEPMNLSTGRRPGMKRTERVLWAGRSIVIVGPDGSVVVTAGNCILEMGGNEARCELT